MTTQLRVTSVGDASNGVVTLDGTTITYRHDGSETTTGGFTYTVTDSTQTMTFSGRHRRQPGERSARRRRWTRSPSRRAARSRSKRNEDSWANDSDAEGDPVSITAVGDVTNGLVTLDGTHDRLSARRLRDERRAASPTPSPTAPTATTALVTISRPPRQRSAHRRRRCARCPRGRHVVHRVSSH